MKADESSSALQLADGGNSDLSSPKCFKPLSEEAFGAYLNSQQHLDWLPPRPTVAGRDLLEILVFGQAEAVLASLDVLDAEVTHNDHKYRSLKVLVDPLETTLQVMMRAEELIRIPHEAWDLFVYQRVATGELKLYALHGGELVKELYGSDQKNYLTKDTKLFLVARDDGDHFRDRFHTEVMNSRPKQLIAFPKPQLEFLAQMSWYEYAMKTFHLLGGPSSGPSNRSLELEERRWFQYCKSRAEEYEAFMRSGLSSQEDGLSPAEKLYINTGSLLQQTGFSPFERKLLQANVLYKEISEDGEEQDEPDDFAEDDLDFNVSPAMHVDVRLYSISNRSALDFHYKSALDGSQSLMLRIVDGGTTWGDDDNFSEEIEEDNRRKRFASDPFLYENNADGKWVTVFGVEREADGGDSFEDTAFIRVFDLSALMLSTLRYVVLGDDDNRHLAIDNRHFLLFLLTLCGVPLHSMEWCHRKWLLEEVAKVASENDVVDFQRKCRSPTYVYRDCRRSFGTMFDFFSAPSPKSKAAWVSPNLGAQFCKTFNGSFSLSTNSRELVPEHRAINASLPEVESWAASSSNLKDEFSVANHPERSGAAAAVDRTGTEEWKRQLYTPALA